MKDARKHMRRSLLYVCACFILEMCFIAFGLRAPSGIALVFELSLLGLVVIGAYIDLKTLRLPWWFLGLVAGVCVGYALIQAIEEGSGFLLLVRGVAALSLMGVLLLLAWIFEHMRSVCGLGGADILLLGSYALCFSLERVVVILGVACWVLILWQLSVRCARHIGRVFDEGSASGVMMHAGSVFAFVPCMGVGLFVTQFMS